MTRKYMLVPKKVDPHSCPSTLIPNPVLFVLAVLADGRLTAAGLLQAAGFFIGALLLVATAALFLSPPFWIRLCSIGNLRFL